MNSTTNTNNQVPRTVIGVSRLHSQLEWYDKAYARAVASGNLKRATECQQHLYEIDSLLSRVSDRIWSAFCAVEEANMMSTLVEVLGEDA